MDNDRNTHLQITYSRLTKEQAEKIIRVVKETGGIKGLHVSLNTTYGLSNDE
jgi:hypothetical protein